MAYIKTLLVFNIFLLLLSANSHCQTEKKNSVLDKPNTFSPKQVITGDTAKTTKIVNYQETLPGSATFYYTPDQDSAYARAMRLYIPMNTRIRTDLKNFALTIKLQKEIDQGTPLQIALKNMQNIPPEALIPTGREIYQREYNIMMSQYVPFVRTYTPGSGVVSFGTIGKLLGLTEDVSPEIKYKLDFFANVEIVVYSIQAKVIATLFSGSQPPGNYTITWNGRNDIGMMMPHGDYIAEVRIGKEKYIRKRIVIN